MKSLAIGLVMAWWFAQLRLDKSLMLSPFSTITSSELHGAALLASLVLGALFQRAIAVKQRARTLALPPLLALAGMAAWLMFVPFTNYKASPYYSSGVRLFIEWAMVVALVLGSAWVALRLAPPEEAYFGPPIGPDGKAPTVRLALALGVVLSLCAVDWTVPWSDGRSLRGLLENAIHSRGGQHFSGRIAAFLTAYAALIVAGVFVWKAKLGPRVVVARPGLIWMTVYLACWFIAQGIALYMMSNWAEMMKSSEIHHDMVALAMIVLYAAFAMPFANAALLWATFRMLFNLGRVEREGEALAPSPAGTGSTGISPGAHIKWLLAERRPKEALVVYANALEAEPGFDPGTSAVVPLAKQALKEHRAEIALRLLEVFGQRRPADTRTPLFRWLHGQALIGAGRVPEGLAELQALMLHDAQDPLAREARDFLSRHGAAG